MKKISATKESEDGMGTKGGWVIALLKVKSCNNYLLSIETRVSNETWSLVSVGNHSPMRERKCHPNSYSRSQDAEGKRCEGLPSSPL